MYQHPSHYASGSNAPMPDEEFRPTMVSMKKNQPQAQSYEYAGHTGVQQHRNVGGGQQAMNNGPPTRVGKNTIQSLFYLPSYPSFPPNHVFTWPEMMDFQQKCLVAFSKRNTHVHPAARCDPQFILYVTPDCKYSLELMNRIMRSPVRGRLAASIIFINARTAKVIPPDLQEVPLITTYESIMQLEEAKRLQKQTVNITIHKWIGPIAFKLVDSLENELNATLQMIQRQLIQQQQQMQQQQQQQQMPQYHGHGHGGQMQQQYQQGHGGGMQQQQQQQPNNNTEGGVDGDDIADFSQDAFEQFDVTGLEDAHQEWVDRLHNNQGHYSGKGTYAGHDSVRPTSSAHMHGEDWQSKQVEKGVSFQVHTYDHSDRPQVLPQDFVNVPKSVADLAGVKTVDFQEGKLSDDPYKLALIQTQGAKIGKNTDEILDAIIARRAMEVPPVRPTHAVDQYGNPLTDQQKYEMQMQQQQQMPQWTQQQHNDYMKDQQQRTQYFHNHGNNINHQSQNKVMSFIPPSQIQQNNNSQMQHQQQMQQMQQYPQNQQQQQRPMHPQQQPYSRPPQYQQPQMQQPPQYSSPNNNMRFPQLPPQMPPQMQQPAPSYAGHGHVQGQQQGMYAPHMHGQQAHHQHMMGYGAAYPPNTPPPQYANQQQHHPQYANNQQYQQQQMDYGNGYGYGYPQNQQQQQQGNGNGNEGPALPPDDFLRKV